MLNLKNKINSQAQKILLSALTFGVSTILCYKLFKKLTKSSPQIPQKYFLTEEQAIFRRSQFMNKEIQYSLCLKLLPGESYQGVISITFHAKYPLQEDIIVDYEGQSIEEIVISGEKLPKIGNSYKYLWDGYQIKLPKAKISGGMNSINIRFSNLYSNTGTGLHSFIDHTDKRQYLYSHCEPDHMHKIIPCFDQPDLKGKFKLFLILPKDWIGISNEILINKLEFNPQSLERPESHHRLIFDSEFFKGLSSANHNIWDFSITKPISTYLFSIIVGPFCEYKCEKTYKNLPMSFYCRESLYKFLKNQVEELLEITNLCMEFFENYFQTNFPFSKYDQIFCPEYNSGAMEHPGAVTLNDTYIYRDKVNPESLTFRAITISHELSHMWFGDLVTMTWWDDLWLNESFAEFFSHFSLSKVKLTKPLGDMTIAFNSSKGYAYRCDQMRTTHPISGKIRNTDEISNYFDGITYSKGAAVLNQLMFLIGENSFSQALGVYFTKYKWDNACLDDFMAVLNSEYEQKNNKIPLNEWKQEWLNLAGLNECYPVWDKNANSKEETLTFIQTATLKEFSTLRNHKMKLAFFLENSEIGEVKDIFLENKKETTIKYDGSAGYKAVLMNYEDYSYVKIVLDPQSIEFFKLNLKKISHSLSRSMIWRAFYDMVRDGKLSSNEYAEIVERNADFENDETILNDSLNYAYYNFSWTPISYKKELGHKLFQKIYAMIKNEHQESKLLILKSFLIKFAFNHNDIDTLYQWLKGIEDNLKTFEISMYDAWDIVKAIYRSPKYSLQEKQEMFNNQALKDPESSKFMEKTFKALIANEQERKTLWEYYLKEKNPDSVQLIAASMEGFNDEEFNLEKYYDLYFAALINVSRKREAEFSKAFCNTLFPNIDDFVYLKRKIDEVMGLTKETDISLRKFLAEEADMIERRLNACERFIISYKGN